MTNIRMFVGFLKLTEETAIELGLKSLTPYDRVVLTALWEKSIEEQGNFFLGFSEFSKTHNDRQLSVSKAQFHKSIQRFLSFGLLHKFNDKRTQRYLFIK